jgi:leader peptidase (prepilin peptidase)/N-methyltransferase
MTILVYFVAIMLGAALGSFGVATADRMRRGESILWPPSHCTSCGLALRPWENIPIVAWLALRGRCARCGAQIPVEGWIWEVTGAVMGAAGAFFFTR